jgi:hypothetical protein
LRKGNFRQAFNPQGWEFHRYLENTFGGVIKLHGFLGVCFGAVGSTLTLTSRPQDKQLYVADPQALQHILMKDQYFYEEPSWLIE